MIYYLGFYSEALMEFKLEIILEQCLIIHVKEAKMYKLQSYLQCTVHYLQEVDVLTIICYLQSVMSAAVIFFNRPFFDAVT